MVVKQLDIHMQKKNELDTDFTLFSEINLKWIMGLIVKCKTRKLLQYNMAENSDDLGYGHAF